MDELEDLLSEFGARYHVAKSGNEGWDGKSELLKAKASISALIATQVREGYKAGYNDCMGKKHPRYLLGYDPLNLPVEDSVESLRKGA